MSKNLLEDFVCPECGNRNALEEIMENVTVVSTILSIAEDGDIVYGKQSNSDGEVYCYQCGVCGFEIRYKNMVLANESTELGTILAHHHYYIPEEDDKEESEPTMIEQIKDMFPNLDIQTDNDGQYIIYTGEYKEVPATDDAEEENLDDDETHPENKIEELYEEKHD